MKTRLVITVLVASAGLMAQPPAPRGRMGFGPGPGGPMGPGGPAMGRTVTNAPYSALEVRTEQQVLAGGNSIQRQSQTTIHRDSQGRVRTETETSRQTASGAVANKRVMIHDPVAGMMHELDATNKTARSMQVRGPMRQGLAAGTSTDSPRVRTPNGPGPRGTRPVDPNVKTEDLGTQMINGVSATGTRMTRTIPAGTIGNAAPIETIHERWVSADLGVPVMVKTSDPRFGTTTTELRNINRAEPDATLFTVPSDYTVTRGGGMMGGRGPGNPRPARNQDK